MRVRVSHLKDRKQRHEKFAVLTAYDATIARLLERAAERHVGLERARIPRQVVLVVELQRIDEDGDDNLAIFTAGFFNQCGMTGVQRTHGRHQAERAIGTLRQAFPEPVNGLDELEHGIRLVHLRQTHGRR